MGHRPLAAILMMAISGMAHADWTPVTETDFHIVYLDYGTLRPSGENVRIWQLFDAHESYLIAGNPFMSIKGHYEYDCHDRRVRSLYRSWHAFKMGGGNTSYVMSYTGDWEPVMPESVADRVFRKICR